MHSGLSFSGRGDHVLNAFVLRNGVTGRRLGSEILECAHLAYAMYLRRRAKVIVASDASMIFKRLRPAFAEAASRRQV